MAAKTTPIQLLRNARIRTLEKDLEHARKWLRTLTADRDALRASRDHYRFHYERLKSLAKVDPRHAKIGAAVEALMGVLSEDG